jgi:hypothetical protein
MSYDPTLPANNSEIVSAELRNQFNGLKAFIDAQDTVIAAQDAAIAQQDTLIETQQAMIDAQAALINGLQSRADDLQAQITAMPAVLGGAKNIDGFVLSTDEISDPPQKAEVEDIQGQLVNLVQALKH